VSVPVAPRPNWTPEETQRELVNNAQGKLGNALIACSLYGFFVLLYCCDIAMTR
jgi:hypothetical protein